MFRSVDWQSGEYPERLYKALMNSSTVLTTWDGERLIGMIRALDDSEMLVYIHYVLVDPEYQGRGIAGEMLTRILRKYKDYVYIEVAPEERKNVSFYEHFGLKVHPEGTFMQLANWPEV